MADTHSEPHAALTADNHDSHAPADPNAAPMRADVRETFSRGAIAFCAILGAVAIIGGTVAGLTIVNN